MNIPVCYISGSNTGIITFDGKHFVDNTCISNINRELPNQDYMTCEVYNPNNICTIVGRDNRDYIVCFGDNALYRLNRASMNKYRLSNAVIKNGRLTLIDKVDDLGYRFPDKKIVFGGRLSDTRQSSIGIARKFYGTYEGKLCIIKFSKWSNNKDLINEVKYYKIASILGVRCCKAFLSKYDDKLCCLSFFEYNQSKDMFSSFKKLNKSDSEIYESLSKQEKIEYDKMLLLDYLLLQQDRHKSNIALLNNKMYPLFDNGECLGLGAIGYFSENYRVYVKRLPKSYIKQLIDFKKINQVYKMLDKAELELVNNNIKELNI